MEIKNWVVLYNHPFGSVPSNFGKSNLTDLNCNLYGSPLLPLPPLPLCGGFSRATADTSFCSFSLSLSKICMFIVRFEICCDIPCKTLH